MGRKSAAKRTRRIEASTSPAPEVPVPNRRRMLLTLAAALSICAGVTYVTAKYFSSPSAPAIVEGDGIRGPKGMTWVPGGEFLMGSDHKLAQKNERPAHKVRVHGFWMDKTHVTNAQFAAFVKATGYVTTAERKPDWETMKVQLFPGTPKPPDSLLVPGAMVFVGTAKPVPLNDYSRWWAWVPGADWRHPQGRGAASKARTTIRWCRFPTRTRSPMRNRRPTPGATTLSRRASRWRTS